MAMDLKTNKTRNLWLYKLEFSWSDGKGSLVDLFGFVFQL